MTQSSWRKTALGLGYEYERQVETKGHSAARELTDCAQYDVDRERGTHWDAAVLPLSPGFS